MHNVWDMITEAIRYLIFGWFIYIAFSVGYKKAIEYYRNHIVNKLKIMVLALLTIIVASCFYGFVLLGSQYQDSFTGEDILGYKVVIPLSDRLLETGFMFMTFTTPFLLGWFLGWDKKHSDEQNKLKSQQQEDRDKKGLRKGWDY